MSFIPSRNEFIQYALIALVVIAVVNNVDALKTAVKPKG